MDDQLDNIIKYLDNEMSKNERIDFENRIRKDKALAQEVEFQKGLYEFLKREQPELEQKLSDLGDEFIIEKQKKKRVIPFWIIVSILFLALLTIGYFAFFKQEKPIHPLPPPPEIEEVIPNDEIEELREDTQDVIEPKNKIEKPNPTLPSTPEESIPEEQPIAFLDEKAYERNPMMEEIISANYRTDEQGDTITIVAPKADAVIAYSELISFTVKGSSSTHNKCQIIIYSNRDFDIENDYKTLDASVDGQLIDDLYQFDFNSNLALEKGLYYLVIRKGGSRDVLHISRFTVE